VDASLSPPPLLAEASWLSAVSDSRISPPLLPPQHRRETSTGRPPARPGRKHEALRHSIRLARSWKAPSLLLSTVARPAFTSLVALQRVRSCGRTHYNCSSQAKECGCICRVLRFSEPGNDFERLHAVSVSKLAPGLFQTASLMQFCKLFLSLTHTFW